MSAAPLIALEGVRKAFGSHVVFDGLSLEIRRGEALAIVGGSGCGKSLLLRVLIGLTDIQAGEVRLDGQPIQGLEEAGFLAVRRRVAMMFQAGALFDSLSVGDNVAYPLRTQLDLGEDEILRRVAEKLALVGLAGSEAQRPAALSGGMRKRVALARAIVTHPEVLLLDEPTAGLDPLNTRRVDDLVRSVQRELGITIVVVTHDLPTAYLVADRIAMLAEGRVVVALDPEGFRRSTHPVVRAFVSAMALPGAA